MNETNNTPDQQSYNGWSNYETWAVALWLSNDPNTDEQVREIVREAGRNSKGAQALKDFIEDQNPLVDKANLYADLLRAGLRQVDWHEIVSHLGEE